MDDHFSIASKQEQLKNKNKNKTKQNPKSKKQTTLHKKSFHSSFKIFHFVFFKLTFSLLLNIRINREYKLSAVSFANLTFHIVAGQRNLQKKTTNETYPFA